MLDQQPQGSPLSSSRASVSCYIGGGGPSNVIAADSVSASAPRVARPPSPLLDRRQPAPLRSTVPVVMPPLSLHLPQPTLSFEPPKAQGPCVIPGSVDHAPGRQWMTQEMKGLQAQAMAHGGYRPADWQRGMTTVTEPRRLQRQLNGEAPQSLCASVPTRGELAHPPSPMQRMLERHGLTQ